MNSNFTFRKLSAVCIALLLCCAVTHLHADYGADPFARLDEPVYYGKHIRPPIRHFILTVQMSPIPDPHVDGNYTGLSSHHPVFRDSLYFYSALNELGINTDWQASRRDLLPYQCGWEDERHHQALLHWAKIRLLSKPSRVDMGEGEIFSPDAAWRSEQSLNEEDNLINTAEFFVDGHGTAYTIGQDLLDGEDYYWKTTAGHQNEFLLGHNDGGSAEDLAHNWVYMPRNKSFRLSDKVRIWLKMALLTDDDTEHEICTFYAKTFDPDNNDSYHEWSQTITGEDILHQEENVEVGEWNWVLFDVDYPLYTNGAAFALRWLNNGDHFAVCRVKYQQDRHYKLFPNYPDGQNPLVPTGDYWDAFSGAFQSNFQLIRNDLRGWESDEFIDFSYHTFKHLNIALKDLGWFRNDLILTAQEPGLSDDEIGDYFDGTGVGELILDHYSVLWDHWEESRDSDGNDEIHDDDDQSVQLYSVQDAWDHYINGWWNQNVQGHGVAAAKVISSELGKKFIAPIQCSGEVTASNSFEELTLEFPAWYGEPTPRMVKCQGFLAMCYKPDGYLFHYFAPRYHIYWYDVNGNNEWRGEDERSWWGEYPWTSGGGASPELYHKFDYFNRSPISGLLTLCTDKDSPNDTLMDEVEDIANAFNIPESINGHNTQDQGWFRRNPKYYEAKKFTNYLRVVENELFDLTWLWGADSQDEFVQGMEKKIQINYTSEDGSPEMEDPLTYVHIGSFAGHGPNGTRQYYILVNKRCSEDEDRYINFSYIGDGQELSFSGYIWNADGTVTEFEDDDESYNIFIPAGEGRLLAIFDDGILNYSLPDDIYGTFVGTERYYATETVTVHNTGCLKLMPGSSITFINNGTLVVEGQLLALGKLDTNGDSLVTIRSGSATNTACIELTGLSGDTLQYCKITDLATGILMSGSTSASVYLENCEVSFCDTMGIKAEYGSVTMRDCKVNNNAGDGAYFYSNTFEIDKCDFTENANNGLYAYSVSSSSYIDSCTFSKNCRVYNSGPDGGVRFLNCSPTVTKSIFSENDDLGMYGGNGAYPVLYDPLYNAANTFTANIGHESYWDYSYPSLDYGHNNFSVEDDTIFYFNNNLSTFYARGNYWGGEGPNLGTPSSSVYNATVLEYYPYDAQEQYRVDPEDPVHDIKGKHGAGGIASNEEAQDDLREALDLEADHPLDAMDAWRAIIHNYPSSPAAPIAVEHLLWLTRNYYQNDARMNRLDGLVSFFENVADTTRARMLAWKARRAALWALAAQHNYEAAIHGFEAIINNADNLADSVFAVIDAGTLHLEAEAWARRDTVNRQDAITKPLHTIAPVTFTEHRRKTDELLALLGAGSHDGKPLIPEDYFINQNYPNPFNSTTIIKYGLPESGGVNLVIYDVMGRKVRQLINQPMQAGYHTAVWDGKSEAGVSVSSGVYFYRLNAGGFNKVKKMTMVK